MRRLNKFLILLLLCGAGYAAFTSVRFIDAGDEIGVVQDLRSGRVTRIFSGRRNFIWEGAFPNWYSVYKIPCRRTSSAAVILPIPPLEELKGGGYSIVVPLSLGYTITAARFYDFEYLAEGIQGLDEMLAGRIKGELMKELKNYFQPAYLREALNADMAVVIKRSYEKIKVPLQETGIELVKMEMRGTALLPDYPAYYEGLAHKATIRKMENDNELELKKLKNRLEIQKIENQELYARLNRISEIVKKNPEMIKYLYIESMAKTGKSSSFSEDAGALKIFDDRIKPGIKKGDIDNFK